MSAGKVQNLTYKLNISSHLLNLLYLDLGRHWNHEGVRVSSQRAGKNGIPAREWRVMNVVECTMTNSSTAGNLVEIIANGQLQCSHGSMHFLVDLTHLSA